MDTIKTCPGCGGVLTPLVAHPDTPPWGCYNGCERAWWEAELAIRDQWDPNTRSFGLFPPMAAMHNERNEARSRGTSVRADQIPILDDGSLAFLAGNPPESAALHAEVQAEIESRGVAGA